MDLDSNNTYRLKKGFVGFGAKESVVRMWGVGSWVYLVLLCWFVLVLFV